MLRHRKTEFIFIDKVSEPREPQGRFHFEVFSSLPPHSADDFSKPYMKKMREFSANGAALCVCAYDEVLIKPDDDEEEKD